MTLQVQRARDANLSTRLHSMAHLDLSPAAPKASLLGLPSELRLEIFKALFRGLVVIFPGSSAVQQPAKYSTLASICATCRTFSVEVAPIFYQLATLQVWMQTTTAWTYLTEKVAVSSDNNWLPLVQNVMLSTLTNNGCDLKTTLDTFPNIKHLSIDLAHIDMCLDEAFPKTLEGKEYLFLSNIPAYNRPSADSVSNLIFGPTVAETHLDYDFFGGAREWVRCLVIQRASARPPFTFDLHLRITFNPSPLSYHGDEWVRASQGFTNETYGCQNDISKGCHADIANNVFRFKYYLNGPKVKDLQTVVAEKCLSTCYQCRVFRHHKERLRLQLVSIERPYQETALNR